MFWFAAAALVQAGGQIYGGRQAKKAAKKNEELQRRQAELLYQEAQRDAAKTYEEAVRFAADQKMAFLSSGVEFSGSASDTVKQTLAWGKEEADAILASGKARKELGMTEAKITQSMGRAAFTSSILGAAGTGMSAMGNMKAASAAK